MTRAIRTAVLMVLPCLLSTTVIAVDHGQLYVPAADTVVLEHLPSTSDPRVRQFDALKRQIVARPTAVQPAVALARAYLDYGRDTGDARYLGRAQAVIGPWVLKRPAAVDALLVQATILQSRHQFAESRQLLQTILQRDNANAQAWLTLSSVALVQGDMTEAQRDCAHLMRGYDPLVTAGCIGARATVFGNARSTLSLLPTLLKQETNQPPAIQSWAHGLMADAAKYLGQAARADDEFKTALQLTPGDNFLLADYGDFLLDQGRARETLELTRNFSQSDTSLLRYVMAEAALGLPSATADIATMASRFHDLEQRGDSRLYGREEARFMLVLQHDPSRALKLAQDNWVIQKAPEDMRILLESALAADKPESAKPVLDLLQKTGLEDPRIRALAAKVAARLQTSPTSTKGSVH